MTEFTTWSALRASFPEDLSEEALDLIRAATAPQRHEWRIEATLRAALQAVAIADDRGDDCDEYVALLTATRAISAGLSLCPSPERTWQVARRIVVLLRLDANGIGGPAWCGASAGNPSTARMRWATGLGSGRRNARDGAAWRAAADALSDRLGRLHREGQTAAAGATGSWSDFAADVRALATHFLVGDDIGFAACFARAQIARAAKDLVSEHGFDPAACRAEIAEWAAVLATIREQEPPAPALPEQSSTPSSAAVGEGRNPDCAP